MTKRQWSKKILKLRAYLKTIYGNYNKDPEKSKFYVTETGAILPNKFLDFPPYEDKL